MSVGDMSPAARRNFVSSLAQKTPPHSVPTVGSAQTSDGTYSFLVLDNRVGMANDNRDLSLCSNSWFGVDIPKTRPEMEQQFSWCASRLHSGKGSWWTGKP